MKPFSPLFWPIRYQQGVISILDETLLPHQVVYIEAPDHAAACRAIREMKTRAVGQVLLVMYIFIQLIDRHQGNVPSELLEKVAQEINATRPTLSFKYLTDMVLGWARQGAPLSQAINGFLEGLKHARLAQAKEAAALLKDGDAVLTHCNISGLMPVIAGFAAEQGKAVRFFATETRPYLQGSRLTAWELHEAGFDVTVIADGMAAQVMAEGKISKVIVGADHLAQNGDIANKIGTLQIALAARHFGIPFYVICPPASRAQSGKDIAIEVRPEDELLVINGVRTTSAGVKGYYPAFDVTPAELITGHIKLGVR